MYFEPMAAALTVWVSSASNLNVTVIILVPEGFSSSALTGVFSFQWLEPLPMFSASASSSACSHALIHTGMPAVDGKVIIVLLFHDASVVLFSVG